MATEVTQKPAESKGSSRAGVAAGVVVVVVVAAAACIAIALGIFL